MRSGQAALRTAASDLARLPIQFNPRGFSLAEGIRAGLSTAVIIAASQFLQWPGLIEAALAALLTCLCDAGGPIRRRVPALLIFAVVGALITGGGGLIRGLGPALVLPFAVAGIFCLAYVRVLGQSAQQVGMLLCVVLVLSIDRAAPGIAAAATLGSMFLAGGLWATLLTMVIWPVYPFQPARMAVSLTYEKLALLAADLNALVAGRDAAGDWQNGDWQNGDWESHARAHRGGVREAIEAARAAVLETIRARGPASNRAAQSLIRLETADQLFVALIALSDRLEPATPGEREMARQFLPLLQSLLEQLGQSVIGDSPGLNDRIAEDIAALAAIAAEAGRFGAQTTLQPLLEIILKRVQIAHTLAVPANYLPGAALAGPSAPLWRRVRDPLLDNLQWESLAFRHALRAAVAAAPAIAFTLAWFTPYDHWLTITIVATMQPYFGNTFARALERAGGTILGGILAAAIGLVVTSPLGLAVAMFPLAVFALAVRAVSFGLLMAGMTPMIVLLAEIGQITTGVAGTGEWQIAGARALLTLAGGLIAIVSCYLLWPSWEPQRLGQEVRAAIAAHGRYAEALLSVFLREADAAQLDQARRGAGLASNNVEASVSRALLEPGPAHGKLEAAMVIDAALRRLAGRLSAMQLDPAPDTDDATSWRGWRDWIGDAMRALASGSDATPPRPPPATGAHAEALGRIARQIELMAGTLKRVELDPV